MWSGITLEHFYAKEQSPHPFIIMAEKLNISQVDLVIRQTLQAQSDERIS